MINRHSHNSFFRSLLTLPILCVCRFCNTLPFCLATSPPSSSSSSPTIIITSKTNTITKTTSLTSHAFKSVAASTVIKRCNNPFLQQHRSSSFNGANRNRVIASFATTIKTTTTPNSLKSSTFQKRYNHSPPYLHPSISSSFLNMSSSSSSSSSSSFLSVLPQPLPTTWSSFTHNSQSKDIINKHLVPPLSSSSHKGSSGRVGVLGGSARYTGAPYYAAMASLKVGADLAFVFCAEEAAIPIKCYSPELMVAPVYNAAEFERMQQKQNEREEEGEEVSRLVEEMVTKVTTLIPRMHTLIIGPGLGRDPLVLRATSQIILHARTKAPHLNIILDADALFLLTLEEYKDILKGYRGVVLTPNVMEYRRLEEAFEGWGEVLEEALEGTIVIRKGQFDALDIMSSSSSSNSATTKDTEKKGMVCKEVGGLKRSGGIGDVLAGTLGAFASWSTILSSSSSSSDNSSSSNRDERLLLSCWSACCVVKKATRLAFERKKRAMTAPDILEEIGHVVDEMTTFDEDDGLDSKL